MYIQKLFAKKILYLICIAMPIIAQEQGEKSTASVALGKDFVCEGHCEETLNKMLNMFHTRLRRNEQGQRTLDMQVAQGNERFSTDAALELMFGRDPKDEELLQKNVTLDEFYIIGGFAAVAEDAELQKAGSTEASYFEKLADALEKESPILQARFSRAMMHVRVVHLNFIQRILEIMRLPLMQE